MFKQVSNHITAIAVSVATFGLIAATEAEASVSNSQPLGTTHCYAADYDFAMLIGGTSQFFQNETERQSKGRVVRYRNQGYDITVGPGGTDGFCYWYPN